MKTVIVHTREKEHTYPITIGVGLLREIEKVFDVTPYKNIVIITDKQIEKLLLHNKPQLVSKNTSVIVLPFGEDAKAIETVQDIWMELLKLDCDRSSLIINLGGGVVCDIGGFAAATFM